MKKPLYVSDDESVDNTMENEANDTSHENGLINKSYSISSTSITNIEKVENVNGNEVINIGFLWLLNHNLIIALFIYIFEIKGS